MDEITRLCARDRVAFGAPADVADAGKYVGDRFLLAVMMNTGVRSRCDFEQTAPDRRRDAERRRMAALRSEPGVCAVP